MLEEAEKNAALDKSKKSLVNIIYEYDNLLGKSESLIENSDFTTMTSDTSRTCFTKVMNTMKYNYKKNQLKTISIEVLDDLIYSYDVVLFDFLQTKLEKKGNSSKNSVIDVTDDAIDV